MKTSKRILYYSNCNWIFEEILRQSMQIWILTALIMIPNINSENCPPTEAILPCRCSMRGKELQIWCSHSNLPQIMDGIKAIERNIKGPIDELVLENNQLPALPGRFFGNLEIVRLMLRYNGIERVSNGWLNELENQLVEIYIVEPQLRSIPIESLNGMINMIAITIQSEELKYLPDFSGLLSLNYLNIQSQLLNELQASWFRHLPKLQTIHITGGAELNRLESGLLDGLISLKTIDLSRNGINWIHLRALSRLPNLMNLKLSYNQISDVGMIGRMVKDLENLKKLRLDHNLIKRIEDGSFVDLKYLIEIHLNDNQINEIEYGAFLRVPMLKTIYLHNNQIYKIHPESFLQNSGSGIETIYIYNNAINNINELKSLLDALPSLKFLDISKNLIEEIPYGALRGHGTLEQLYMNGNHLRMIERDALMAMPSLRELRLRNNSLADSLVMPFWNLPNLKGLDLSQNHFSQINRNLLMGLPSLRRLDLSENHLKQIESNAFQYNPMLETLNISLNQLILIHPNTFYHLDRLFEIDASYNQLIELIPGLPSIIERLSLRGNLIAILPPIASKVLHLPNLRMLDLTYNHLEQLPKYPFQGLKQLRVLSLANNRLKQLDDTAFIGINQLELLHLQSNQLTRVDERTFLPLYELRNLNLEDNQLESITDNLFSNNTKLEQLDLSRNNIRSIAPAAFESQRSLEYLDLSGNMLSDLSISLASLTNLRDIDLSYNQIIRIQSDIVSSWRNILEIRLANNLISELKHGTFRNLPKLQYLDLSSNEIHNIEPASLKHLPDLQEFVLADNKLVELKDHVFEDLPNLLASHFQYNSLRYISPECFSNAPSLVFLNLSNNGFRNMENIGLRSMRNLEVLDLSTNSVKVIPTMPLKALNWLVELKMDNNHICKIQGAPFETMPRLRVLSMRNNQLRTMKERTFRNLRGNIAILDVDGNPIVCSCEIQWLSVWLQETNFPYPGPKCKDGRLLRSARIEKSLCQSFSDNQRTNVALALDSVAGNHLPLLNEHGDLFQRDLPNEINDECDTVIDLGPSPSDRPLAGESEYFYDQYVDYTPSNNESTKAPILDIPHQVHTSAPSSQTAKPTINTNIDLNNTILHANLLNKKPQPIQSNSPFTFFGMPLPSISLGRFFGAGHRGRKERLDHQSEQATTKSSSSSSDQSSSSVNSASMPATHRMQASAEHTKSRMYQPNSAEFEKYLTYNKSPKPRQDSQYKDIDSRQRYITNDNLNLASDENISNEPSNSMTFKTAFREPSSVERGGFRPILPEQIGGFMPVHHPQLRANLNRSQTSDTQTTNSDNNYVPIAVPSPKNVAPNYLTTVATTKQPSIEDHTYYVSELSTEVVPATINPFLSAQATLSAPTTPPTVPTEASTTSTTSTASSPTTSTTTKTTSSTHETPIEKVTLEPVDEYDDLEAQAVGLLKPPPFVQSTTTETILLIPPAEELEAQYKKLPWLSSTTTTTTTTSTTSATTTTPSPSYSFSSSTEDQSISNTHHSIKHLPQRPPLRASSGRSTITKVHTPQTLNLYLPTAEEFYRTTSSSPVLLTDLSADQSFINPHAQKHLELIDEMRAKDRIDRKDGMDWYYESYKKPAPINLNAAITGFKGKRISEENYIVGKSRSFAQHYPDYIPITVGLLTVLLVM